MKKILLPIIALGSMNIVFLQAAPDKPAAAPLTPAPASPSKADRSDKGGDMLEYITPAVFKTELAAGKIKPNTFYWANAVNDPTLAPASKMEGTAPCLEIRGGGNSDAAKSFLYRLVPVQEVKGAPATAANVSIDINFEPDFWAPKPPGAAIPSIEVFFADGTRVSGAQPLGITNTKPNTWSTAKRQFAVPPGAKFIGLTISAPAAYIARVRNINISFE